MNFPYIHSKFKYEHKNNYKAIYNIGKILIERFDEYTIHKNPINFYKYVRSSILKHRITKPKNRYIKDQDNEWLIKLNSNMNSIQVQILANEFAQQLIKDKELFDQGLDISDCAIYAPSRKGKYDKIYRISHLISYIIFPPESDENIKKQYSCMCYTRLLTVLRDKIKKQKNIKYTINNIFNDSSEWFSYLYLDLKPNLSTLVNEFAEQLIKDKELFEQGNNITHCASYAPCTTNVYYKKYNIGYLIGNIIFQSKENKKNVENQYSNLLRSMRISINKGNVSKDDTGNEWYSELYLKFDPMQVQTLVNKFAIQIIKDKELYYKGLNISDCAIYAPHYGSTYDNKYNMAKLIAKIVFSNDIENSIKEYTQLLICLREKYVAQNMSIIS